MAATLKAYPWPEGMDIPNLMPNQAQPWNGDWHLAKEVLRLKEAHGLKTALETGTCLGSTAMWLAEHFEHVRTCDIHEGYLAIARARMCDISNVETHWERSTVIVGLAPVADLYWLDAHWGEHCPLLEELSQIAEQHARPVILIHDFQVPGTDFGFDKMPDGRPFNLELVKPYLDRIYGAGLWDHNYPTEVAGARRGWVSIEPWPQPH